MLVVAADPDVRPGRNRSRGQAGLTSGFCVSTERNEIRNSLLSQKLLKTLILPHCW